MNASLKKTLQQENARASDLPIEPQFITRWSPRAYDNSALSEYDLMTIFEAARWAPSAYNVQPWRFLYSLKGSAHWKQYLSLLDPFNADWAKRAGALVFLISSTTVPGSDTLREFPTHSFDAGAAWIHIALQAQALGYHAHALGGIFHERVKEELAIPEHFKVEIGIAIGKIGKPEVLSDVLRQREKPSSRLPLIALIHAGRYEA